jgi:hypothetical protein
MWLWGCEGVGHGGGVAGLSSLSGEGDMYVIVIVGGDAEGVGMRKVAVGCRRVGGDMVMCQSWWRTDTCASTVGVHCSTPTSVKHSNQYTYMRKFTYFGV